MYKSGSMSETFIWIKVNGSKGLENGAYSSKNKQINKISYVWVMFCSLKLFHIYYHPWSSQPHAIYISCHSKYINSLDFLV